MIRKILIANRGEIAWRIMRTCRAMGIATVAVYSEADAAAPHTLFADEAVNIGEAPAIGSYLNSARIIEAAKMTAADAIHPGYGFLSEQADFAEACLSSGLTFIGPPVEAIRRMGFKIEGRKLAEENGVPIIPGSDGIDQSAYGLRAQILQIGFPVLIKASAGGGGRGMRLLWNEDEIDEALESARREAEKSFGDGSLLVEKYLHHARHIEIQILGDQHGNLIYLFERDCSLQRRHQKIIEESPSPAINPGLLEKLGKAAVALGKALNYTNAGTVEFLVTPNGEFYFIEINTRLQVEHPVTEMITGLDLVRLQIEIAEGQPLPVQQLDVMRTGQAIEARLYAEDPDHDFLPTSGKVTDWLVPPLIEGLRLDAGIDVGSRIGIHYDPLLAKIIAHGKTRREAIRKLNYALRSLSIQGFKTNRDFLLRLIEHRDFIQGNYHTNFINENWPQLATRIDEDSDRILAIVAALYSLLTEQQKNGFLQSLPVAYRNNIFRHPGSQWKIGDHDYEVALQVISSGKFKALIDEERFEIDLISNGENEIRLAINGLQRLFRIIAFDDGYFIHSSLGSREIFRAGKFPEYDAVREHGAAESPMPGVVLKIFVTEGQEVVGGDALILLEAMKMEQTIRAGADGVVESIKVKIGQVVSPGDVLVQIKSA